MNDASAKLTLRLDFPEAMRAAGNGRRVARMVWDRDYFVYLARTDPADGERRLVILLPGGRENTWLISESDMRATDWVIVDEQSPVNTPPKCSNANCKTPNSPVILGPDPYAQDVGGDDTPVWECQECRDQSAQDI